MRWCRDMEAGMQREFLETFYPHEQATLEFQAGSLPIELFDLQPESEESEADKVRRDEFNKNQKPTAVIRATLWAPSLHTQWISRVS